MKYLALLLWLFSFQPKIKSSIVVLQPFSDVSSKKINYVFAQLKKINPNIELKKSIDLPDEAYYKPRSRFRADYLIHYLAQRTPDGYTTIGITTKDISTTKNSHYEWGVMGLSYCPGKACVVSDYRLSVNDQCNQFFKVVVHELGHTQGLRHCPVKTCFMQDAKGKNSTGHETGFCPSCKSYLIVHGWKL